jgi:hypothetical protein
VVDIVDFDADSITGDDESVTAEPTPVKPVSQNGEKPDDDATKNDDESGSSDNSGSESESEHSEEAPEDRIRGLRISTGDTAGLRNYFPEYDEDGHEIEGSEPRCNCCAQVGHDLSKCPRLKVRNRFCSRASSS